MQYNLRSAASLLNAIFPGIELRIRFLCLQNCVLCSFAFLIEFREIESDRERHRKSVAGFSQGHSADLHTVQHENDITVKLESVLSTSEINKFRSSA